MKKAKKVKVSFTWPKESKKAKKAIDTLINEGYTFHTSVSFSVHGTKKAFALQKEPV